MAIDISNSDDTIDTRDVWKRIEELEELEEAVNDAEEAVDAAVYELDEFDSSPGDEGDQENIDHREKLQSTLDEAEASLVSAEAEFDDDAQSELKALRKLQDQAEGYCDWHSGSALIRESYFKEWVLKDVQDTREVDALPSYIRDNIDWDGVASDLESDYTQVDYDGTTYYVA